MGACNQGLGHGEAAAPAEFRRAARAPGRGSGGARPLAHLGPGAPGVGAEELPERAHGDGRWRRPWRFGLVVSRALG
jgi:hypothetical protein